MTEFIETVILGSFGSAGLLAVAAYLCKTRISHWLNKDLEALKNQYARELEAYKVQLIAQTEQIKATNEVKKAGALKVLELRYQSITSLITTITGTQSNFAAVTSAKPENKTEEDFMKCYAAIDELNRAFEKANPFLSREQKATIVEFSGALIALLPHTAPDSPSFTSKTNPTEMDAALRLELKIEHFLFAMIDDMTKI